MTSRLCGSADTSRVRNDGFVDGKVGENGNIVNLMIFEVVILVGGGGGFQLPSR